MVGNVMTGHHYHTLTRIVLVLNRNMVLHVGNRYVCYVALILNELMLLALLYMALLPFQFCLP